MEEKPDINMEFNKVVVPKKQGIYGPNNYIYNFELSTDPLDLKFGIASHCISSHDGRTDTENQTKHQYIQKAFVSNITKVEKPESGALNVT